MKPIRVLVVTLLITLVAPLVTTSSVLAVTPVIAAVSPSSVPAESGAIALSIDGANFEFDSVVQWNGANRSTDFESSTRLYAIVRTTDLVCPGTASVRVQNRDGSLSNEVPFVVTNAPPVAGGDTATTDEDVPVTIDVLTNDAAPETCDTVSIASFTDGSAGTVTASGTSLVYTPDQGFSGTDTFTYTAEDSFGGTAVAEVTVTVSAVNAAPSATGDTYQVRVNKTLSVAAPGVLANDTDPDGDALAASLVAGPSNGRLTLNADGSFTYRPNRRFNGTESFTSDASDGTIRSTATVTIQVISR